MSSWRPAGSCTYIFKQGEADDPADKERKVNGEEVEREFDRSKQEEAQGHADSSDGYGVYQARICRAIDAVENVKEACENAEDDSTATKLKKS